MRLPISLACGLLITIASISLSADEPAGDRLAGEQEYGRCLGCHSLDRNRTGPRHCGLINRRAGTQPGYEYSRAMLESSLVWNPETLDRFLTSPLKIVPGSTMGFAGIKDKRIRRKLIAYLTYAMNDRGLCPQ